ncbi:alpha beta-hydrolase [Mycena rebaudengoi]|nr:alpha beta-hydrolase [Mycena rebaudengoi]
MRVQNLLGISALWGGQYAANLISSPVIDLGYARYQGAVDTSTNITSFLGIRYAAPPTGDLRFRAPYPPSAVSGVQQAVVQPDQCFQAGLGAAPTTPVGRREVVVASSEDCLSLSVYYPSNTGGVPVGRLPTLVYFHGGGYVLGASSQFRGSDIINQSNRGVVVVIVQYRLGLFGFLAGSAMKKHGTLNNGLLDQDFALRWIKKHISKFGGDPSKVTIWGESAGAGSVLQHVIANGGETKPQLFRGAITSSTCLLSQYNYNDRIPEMYYSKVVAQTNCTRKKDSMACLRAADAAVLETANVNINAAALVGTLAFTPVVDGEFIRERPTRALASGKVNGKALLAVTNAFEGNIFVDPSIPATRNISEYAMALYPYLRPAQAEKVGALYAMSGTPLSQSAALYGDTVFMCPTYALLRAFSGRSFKSVFAILPGLHGRDLPYYFAHIGTDVPLLDFPVFNNTQFINAFAQSFTAFAISLDPNVKIDPDSITPRWDQYKSYYDGGCTEMVFNKTEGDVPDVRAVKTQRNVLERCEFWTSVGGLTGH